MSKPLVIVPVYMTEDGDLDMTLDAVRSVRDTAGDQVDVQLVDDGSPNQDLVQKLDDMSGGLQFDLYRKHENSGFAKTVNIGLNRALEEGRDAILMNADMEVTTKSWLNRFQATTDERDNPAAVVGSLLLYPDGTIQHAGVYFSLLTRTFDHRFKHGPGNLPEALRKEVCPVTAAFQFIRHSTLVKVGVYDEQFFMGWEDVDYCIRVFLAGEQCIYNPNIRGFHHEMKFRGRPNPKIADWQNKSFVYLVLKYANQSFAGLVPNW